MKFNKTLISILAIFAVVLSVCAVSAVEDMGGDILSDDNTTVGDENDTYSGDDTNDTDSGEEGGYVDGGEVDAVLITGVPAVVEVDDNVSSSGAPESHQSEKVVDTHNTGNPVLVLLAACALLTTATIRRK